jgi:hypothetical protein
MIARLPAESDLQRSHTELRAALILAGRRLSKVSPHRRADPFLRPLRRVLREARAIAKAYRTGGKGS